MDHIAAIELGLKDKKPYVEIARKVYLTYPTNALVGEEERQFQILDAISHFFQIPIMAIQVVGSAKTGKSFHKESSFTPGVSDLDIAVIDTSLFISYMEIAFLATKGYSDGAKFPIYDGVSTKNQYLGNLSRGFFRPDLMPICTDRAEWSRFFGNLSSEHSFLFKSINAGIYLSQVFFEQKQRKCIRDFATQKAL